MVVAASPFPVANDKIPGKAPINVEVRSPPPDGGGLCRRGGDGLGLRVVRVGGALVVGVVIPDLDSQHTVPLLHDREL